MSTSDKITQGVLVRTDTLFLLDNGYLCLLALHCIFVAPLIIHVECNKSEGCDDLEYCKEAGRLCQC